MGHPDYAVTAHSFPNFLYAGDHCDPQDPEAGLFRNLLLVKVRDLLSSKCLTAKYLHQAYKFLFTSPTSAAEVSLDTTGPQPEDLPPRKRSRRTGPATRSNVANIIGMQSVTPRSIAYTAVQAWIFNAQVVFDHSLIAVSSSYVLHYPVLVLGVLSTWTSITRSSITPLSITLRLPQDLLPKPLLMIFLLGGISACFLNDCCSTLLIIRFRKVFGRTKYGASYLTVPQVGTSVARLSEHRQARESQVQAVSQ